MSTIFSSSGVALTSPDVPAYSDGGAPPPPRSDRKSTPVNQLSRSTTRRPPMPMGAPIRPTPDRPRMSSMLPRLPGVHLIANPLRGETANRTPRGCLTDIHLNVLPLALMEARDG